MTRRQRQQPTDPAHRALQAAQECRAATREAHEAMRGLTEAARELKAAIAQARQLNLDHLSGLVPEEVARQLHGLAPTLARAIKADLARLEGGHAPPNEAAVADVDGSQRCPYCGYVGDGHKPVGDDPTLRPHAAGNSVSICGGCSQPSIFDSGPLPGDLVLRKPTPVEAAKIAKNSETRRAIRLTQRFNAGQVSK